METTTATETRTGGETAEAAAAVVQPLPPVQQPILPLNSEKMKIMAAIDDSDESFYALRWVLDNLFRSYDNSTALAIIHAIEPFPQYTFPGAHAVFPTTSIIQPVNKAQEENAAGILDRAAQICMEKKVEAKTLVVRGDPKETICNVAEQMHIDLIVVGSRGKGKIKRALLGSVSDHIAHHASCPVVIVKTPKG